MSKVLRGANGDRKLAAAALSMNVNTLNARILSNAQLRAIWGQKDEVEPKELQPSEVLQRTPDVLPTLCTQTVELAEMVAEADKIQHALALGKLGLSDKAIERLKTLEGLAQSSGKFIAISLETTHRLYYVQNIELSGLAHDLLRRLQAPKGDPDHIVDDEMRAMLNKNYIEMVKEGGRAFELMLTGTQAFVAMMRDPKNRGDSPGVSKKPAWRKVAAADRPKTDA